MNRFLIAIALVAVGCARPATSPDVVYGELVDAGCLSPVEGGAATVAQAIGDPAAPPWLTCMSAGGSVSSCAVPCSP